MWTENYISREVETTGHSMQDLLQGQIDAGFLIAGYYDDTGYSLLDNYLLTFFATKAIKI